MWARLVWVLEIEGADARTLGNFFVAVVKASLLFGAYMWVMSSRMAKTLGASTTG